MLARLSVKRWGLYFKGYSFCTAFHVMVFDIALKPTHYISSYRL